MWHKTLILFSTFLKTLKIIEWENTWINIHGENLSNCNIYKSYEVILRIVYKAWKKTLQRESRSWYEAEYEENKIIVW